MEGDEDIATDNPNQVSTGDTIGEGKDTAVICIRTKTWANMDYVKAQLSGKDDPFDALVKLIARWGVTKDQQLLILEFSFFYQADKTIHRNVANAFQVNVLVLWERGIFGPLEGVA